jgi:hypothetical protein
MPASLDDILTTQKNGVVAINTLGQYLGSLTGFIKGTTISRTAMSTSTSTLYTVNAGYQFALRDIEICNTSTAPATFTIYLVPSGGTASAANAIFYNAPINGSTTVQWSGEQILDAGSTIQASASATTVTIMVAGGQI